MPINCWLLNKTIQAIATTFQEFHCPYRLYGPFKDRDHISKKFALFCIRNNYKVEREPVYISSMHPITDINVNMLQWYVMLYNTSYRSSVEMGLVYYIVYWEGIGCAVKGGVLFSSPFNIQSWLYTHWDKYHVLSYSMSE